MHENELFNHMADYYDLYRPGYPPAAVEAIIQYGKLTEGSRLLEVGSGSGKATGQFLGKGFSLTCLDPGHDLVARGNAQYGKQGAQFLASSFEEFAGEAESWDMIFSAQAFHWIRQPDGYRQCARLLKPGGTVALMWNLDLFGENQEDCALWDTLYKYSGFVACMQKKDYPPRQARIAGEMEKLFGKPEVLHFTHQIQYTPEEYYRYMTTSQVFFQQDESTRMKCLAELKTLIAKYPNVLCRRYICEVYLAQKPL